MLGVIMTACIVIMMTARRLPLILKNRLVRVLALIPVLTEVLKVSFLILGHRMSIGHLPLHLCSLSIFLYPISAYLCRPGSFFSSFINEAIVCVMFPAGLSALLLPDWTMYPLISFMSLTSFLWHGAQVLYPLLLLSCMHYRPRLSRIWQDLVFLLIFGLPVYAFDLHFRCNYWFLLAPVPGTPLEPLYDLAGPAYYVPGLFLFASSLIFAWDCILVLFFRISGLIIRRKDPSA
ncbi:MAG: YwaF family protein [Lachnospiraceae bacterium]|nr:YwaF family protein [Lachnospiraceae bacterium]